MRDAMGSLGGHVREGEGRRRVGKVRERRRSERTLDLLGFRGVLRGVYKRRESRTLVSS